jgi:hypothetical protein
MGIHSGAQAEGASNMQGKFFSRKWAVKGSKWNMTWLQILAQSWHVVFFANILLSKASNVAKSYIMSQGYLPTPVSGNTKSHGQGHWCIILIHCKPKNYSDLPQL